MALKLKWQWRNRLGKRQARAFLAVALVLAVLGVLVANLPRTERAAALAKGSGRLFYGENNSGALRYREWVNSTNTFGSELSQADSGNSIHHVRAAASPTRNEQIVAYSKQAIFGTQLQVQRWNGSSWSLDWQVSVGYNASAPRFDVAYSQVNGQAYVFYTKNNQLAYRMYNGTSWTSESTYTATRSSGNLAYIKALARPGTNEIAVIWGTDSNMDMSANYLNAATGTWAGEPGAALSLNISRVGNDTSVNSDFADMAFEGVSGDLLVCWGDEDVLDLKCVTRSAGVSGSWGSVQTYASFAAGPTDMKLASEPGTDYVAYNNAQDDDTTTRSAEAAIWDGSTWGNITNYDTSINSVGGSNTGVSVGWLKSGGQSRVVATYDDNLSGPIDWRMFNKNTSTWAAQTPVSPAITPSGVDDYMHLMRANPYNSSELMFFLRDWGSDLLSEKITFDGTNVTWTSTDPPGTTLETEMQTGDLNRGWSADLVHYRYVTSYDQTRFRIFANADSTNVGAPLASVNTAATLPSAGAAFRVRAVIEVSGAPLAAGMEEFKLQYAGKGFGSCDAPSGTPSTYADVTTSTPIAFYNNPTPSDGAALTANANDPSADVNQTYEELNNFTATSQVAVGDRAMWDFALKDNGAPVNTAYCLRVVKNDGTPLELYSKHPQITTSAITNVAPDAPVSLTQKKADTSSLSTGGWVNDGAVTFGATLSDPDGSDTLQLCVEKKPLGVAFANTEDSCSSGVAYAGSGVAASVEATSLSEGEYHWQARTRDAEGEYSSWVSFGGNAESARDYGVDTTAPTGGTVYDGSSAGVDAAFGTTSVSALSANWSGFSAGVSGLSRYDYSVGTAPGSVNVRGWTSNGTATTVTASGLSLRTSQKYYVNVRAVDNAGNVQSGVSSDGQMVLPSLSFGLSSDAVTFNSLNAGNGYTDTQSTDVITSTNAYGGYAVRAYATGNLTGGAFSILGFSGGTYSEPDAWLGGDTGLGYTSSDTLVQGVNKFQAATCPGGSTLAAPGCFAPFSNSQPGDIVADHEPVASGMSINNDTYTITYKVTAPATQAATQYTTNVVYSVVPVY